MLPTGLFADMEDLLSVSLGKNLFATFPEGLKSLTQDNNPNLESLHIGPDFPHGGLFSEPVSGWIATLPTSLDDLLLQYIQLTSDEAVTLSENLTELHTLEFDYRKMDLAHFIEFIENIKTNSGTTGFRELQLTATGEFAVGCGSSSNGSPLASYESASATVKQEFADAFDGLWVDDLTIYDPTITPDALEAILGGIKKDVGGQELRIECGELNGFEGDALSDFTGLESLTIKGSELDLSDFAAIVANLAGTTIKTLDLRGNRFIDPDNFIDLENTFNFDGVLDTLEELKFAEYIYECKGPWKEDFEAAGFNLSGVQRLRPGQTPRPFVKIEPAPRTRPLEGECALPVALEQLGKEDEGSEPNWPPATIMNIEPAVSAIRVWTGREVVLTTEVYGVQGILDNDLADAVSPDEVWFDWIDESRNADFAEFTNRPMRINDVADDREVIYQVPTIPGNYTVSVNVPFAAHCKGPRAEMDETMEEAIARCTAEFELIVRYQRNSDDEVGAPVNPDGPIPASVVNDRGVDCPVFTPEEGGLLDAVDHSVSVEAGAVQNNTAVAICVNKAGTASNVGFTQHRYTLHGDLYSVTAFDLNGRELSEYEFNFPIEACIPLPDALRTRISDVELAVVERDRSLTVLQSNTAFTHGGIRTCGSLGELPAMIAVGAKGAPSALLEPEEELPDTGPGAPSLPRAIFGILAGLVAMSLSLAAVRFGRHREYRRSR